MTAGGDGRKPEGGGTETEVVSAKLGADSAGAPAPPVVATATATEGEVAPAPPKKRGMLAAIADSEARAAKKQQAVAAETQLGLGVAAAPAPEESVVVATEAAPAGELLPSTMPVYSPSGTETGTGTELASASTSESDAASESTSESDAASESASAPESDAASESDTASESDAASDADADAASASSLAPSAPLVVVSPASTAVAEPISPSSTPAAPARPRRPREDLDDDRIAAELSGGGSARRSLTLAGVVLVVLGIAAAFIAGHFNHQRYVLECGTDSVTPKRGRSFPPWGEASLDGAQWKPVAIPPAAECRDRQARSESELSGWYLDLLIEQASLRLTARKVVDIDLAAAQLDQALLLARAPERREKRRDVERLFGDIEYWRAVEKLRSASESLAEAAKQFEEAAQKQPKHVTDASVRAQQLRRFLDELEGRISPAIGNNPPILLPSSDPDPEPSPAVPPATSQTSSETAPSIPSPSSIPPLDPAADPAAASGDAGPSEAPPVDAGPSDSRDSDPATPAPPPSANPSAGGVLL